MPSNKRNRIHWLLNVLNGYEYKPASLAIEMQNAFMYVGCPTKGGTTERARQLLTKAKKLGYVDSDRNGWWSLTDKGQERLLITDNREFHGKVSGHIKIF